MLMGMSVMLSWVQFGRLAKKGLTQRMSILNPGYLVDELVLLRNSTSRGAVRCATNEGFDPHIFSSGNSKSFMSTKSRPVVSLEWTPPQRLWCTASQHLAIGLWWTECTHQLCDSHHPKVALIPAPVNSTTLLTPTNSSYSIHTYT